MTTTEKEQLFSLFGQLGSFGIDDRNLGKIISYAILEGLLVSDIQTSSSKERMIQEMKSIYDSIENVVYECKGNDYYPVLCEQIIRFEERSNHQSQGIQDEKGLKRSFLQYIALHERNYEDRFRRDGLKLYNCILKEGSQKGTMNSIEQNYESIKRIYIQR